MSFRTLPLVTLHYPHDSVDVWRDDHYNVMTIDPAVSKNLQITIRKRSVLTGVVVAVIMLQVDFGKQAKDAAQTSNFVWLSNYFDTFLHFSKECHIILIERQQVTKNTKVMMIAQHLVSYFVLRLKNNPKRTLIYEVDARLKTHIFNGPKGELVKPWAVNFSLTLLHMRKDVASLQRFNQLSRIQDACDNICMEEAFFTLNNLPTRLQEPVYKYLNFVATAGLPPAKKKKKSEGKKGSPWGGVPMWLKKKRGS